jgi:cytochrome bd ubiquinol oxidase subunit II
VHLYELPLIFALIGLALYTVLGGADFGTGIWQLTAGSGPDADRIREHAHESMAPVWEANHVWLIFVLTVVWTSYPTAFGSIASTLSFALFLAGLGIILRGAAYALRSATRSARETRAVDAVFSISSILTPFGLGAAVGGIASQRVPVGNATGHLFSSWLNGTSVVIGVVAVGTSAYLAAVFLAADAARQQDAFLERQFRLRALIAGGLAGVIAIAGIAVLQSDAHPLYHGLVEGDGLPALIVSVIAGLTTLLLVWQSRFEPARYTGALAVAAIIAGWALAQQPIMLPGLTIKQAAAPHDALVLVVVVVLAGAALLFPSLALLFRLVLGGRLGAADGVASSEPVPSGRTIALASIHGIPARAAGACLIGGFGFLTIAEAGWAHAIGVVCLLGFVILGFMAVGPAALAANDPN